MSETQKNIVDVNALAEFFEVEPRTIQYWADDGMPRVKKGEYNFLECVKWRIRYLEKEKEELGREADKALNELKKEGQGIMNQFRKIRLMKELGEIIPREDVKIAWLTELSILKQNFNGTPNRLSVSLDGVTDKNERFEIIRKEIEEVFKGISELPIETDRFDVDEMEGLLSDEPDNEEQN